MPEERPQPAETQNQAKSQSEASPKTPLPVLQDVAGARAATLDDLLVATSAVTSKQAVTSATGVTAAQATAARNRETPGRWDKRKHVTSHLPTIRNIKGQPTTRAVGSR